MKALWWNCRSKPSMPCPTNQSCAAGLEHALALRIASSSTICVSLSSSNIAWPKSPRQSLQDLPQVFIHLRVGPSGQLSTAPGQAIRCQSPPAWPHAPPDCRFQRRRYRPRRFRAPRHFRPCTPCTRRCALGNMPLPHRDLDTRGGRERYISLWLRPFLGNLRPGRAKRHQTRSYLVPIPPHRLLRHARFAS
jgi:hypothetical protein